MLKLEDIIEGLNRSIEDYRKARNIVTTGHLVIQKSIKPHKTFKAYKEYEVIVWFINGKNKYKTVHYTETAHIIDGREERILKEINISVCRFLFNFVNSSMFEKVITGEYNGYKDE